MQYLDFEKPLEEIEEELEKVSISSSKNFEEVAWERQKLLDKREKLIENLYKKLTPWQKTCVARHEERPHTLDYIREIFTDFFPLAGDKYFSEDVAIVAGFAKIGDERVMLIGQEKGFDTASRLKYNFGMVKPEGYRKAIRLMKLAERFSIPVITLVDTAGAYPGIEAEERGQGRAIAEAIQTCLTINVPLISCIIGEGGSGGALALAAANSILMLENSVYSVISPEGCASILLKDATMASKMAQMLHLTAQDLEKFGLIDEIIQEPKGGAHRFKEETMKNVKNVLLEHIRKWKKFTSQDILRIRQEKFLAMTRLEGK